MRRGLLEGVLYRQASNHIRLGKGEFSGVSNAGLKDNGEPPRRVVRETYWDAITEPNPAARFWNAPLHRPPARAAASKAPGYGLEPLPSVYNLQQHQRLDFWTPAGVLKGSAQINEAEGRGCGSRPFRFKLRRRRNEKVSLKTAFLGWISGEHFRQQKASFFQLISVRSEKLGECLIS